MNPLEAFIVSQVARHEPEEFVGPPAPPKPPKPPPFEWLPIALEFVRSRGGEEVLSCEIHSHLKNFGKPPNPQSMTNTLDRAIRDGRAKGLETRVELNGRGFYKLAYWRWNEGQDHSPG